MCHHTSAYVKTARVVHVQSLLVIPGTKFSTRLHGQCVVNSLQFTTQLHDCTQPKKQKGRLYRPPLHPVSVRILDVPVLTFCSRFISSHRDWTRIPDFSCTCIHVISFSHFHILTLLSYLSLVQEFVLTIFLL
jgi:hypothetical protein